MPIQFLARSAKLTDVVTVEEAEGLLQWILAHPKGKLDLARCTHVHTAALQVLLALRPPVSSLPEDASLAAWLAPTLNHQ
jgi:hypothetical protein